MPEKLLCPSYGIPKSILNQITVTENDVISGKSFLGSDGILKTGNIPDRGQYQYSQVFYNGDSYIALEDIPEGVYRKNGESWAPEIRLERSKLTLTPKAEFGGGCWGNRINNGYGATGSAYCSASHDSGSGTVKAKVSGYFITFQVNQNKMYFGYYNAGSVIRRIDMGEDNKYLIAYVYI